MPDIFTPQQNKADAYELVLNFHLKIHILKLMQLVWFNDESVMKNQDIDMQIFRKFVALEASKL